MPEDELREAILLGNKFRAATAKRRLLIVLDAARDARQIEAILPGGDRCMVIVTSRANLAGTRHRAWRVDTPRPAESARILNTYLTTDTDLPSDIKMPPAELIAEAAELCGHQPVALRAIGEKARHTPGSLAEVVSELRDPLTRLRRLAYGGRDPAERIATEYDQLGRRNQAALQALALIDAPSFVPWVLQPLLETGLPESHNLMAALSEVGLLDESQTDPAGFPRYAFSPLVRLFAERELRKALASNEASMIRTEGNFRLGLVLLAMHVNAELDPREDFGNPPNISPDWIPDVRNWKSRVAEHADYWIRVEFSNLIEAIREAYNCRLYTLTWKLSAQLTDHHVFHPFTDAVRDAFEKARAAAASADDPRAVASVRLAEGSCQLAGERYAMAVATLTDAFQAAEALGANEIIARARRHIGQAEQRLGAYAAASRHLRAALDAIGQAECDGTPPDELAGEKRIIEVLLAENDFFTKPERWVATDPGSAAPHLVGTGFTEYLFAARIARHHNKLAICEAELQKAADMIDDDESFAFQLRYERIACSLLKDKLTPAERADVIADAAHLVVTSASAGAKISTAEARILLARALVTHGDPKQCLRILGSVQLSTIPADHTTRLQAQRLRLQSEAQYTIGDYARAEESLLSAASQFGAMQDLRSQADALILLGSIQLKTGRRSAAQLSLLTALETFQRCGDTRNADRALAALARPAFILAARTTRARVKSWLLHTPNRVSK